MKTNLPVIRERAQYVRFKDYDLIKLYDHDDVTVGFKADRTLMWVANALASIGVCVLLLLAVAVIAEIPDKWIAW